MMKKKSGFLRVAAFLLSAVMVLTLIPATAVRTEAAVVAVVFDEAGGQWSIPALRFRNTEPNGKLSAEDLKSEPGFEGFTFNGWYSAANGGTKITTDTVFTQKTYIYAHWTRSGKARDYEKLAGDDRYETAVELAKYRGPSVNRVFVIVTGSKFPDALSANAYAGFYDAPILLSKLSEIPYCVQELLNGDWKGKFDTAVVIGKEFKTGFFNDLSALGFSGSNVKWIGGDDRFETARDVCQALIDDGKILGDTMYDTVAVATGKAAADAISFSPYSYGWGIPILLTGTGGVADSKTKEMVGKFKNVVLLGAEPVVADSVLSEKQKSDKTYVRLGGNDRYETSVKIVSHYLDEREEDGITKVNYWLPNGTFIADGTNAHFPDALVAGQACGGNPIVLVQEGKTGNASMNFIRARAGGSHATGNLFYFAGYAAKSNSFGEVIAAIQTA